MKFSIVIFLSLIFTSNAFSACSAVSCTGVKITRIVVTVDGSTSIGTSGDESKLSCEAGSAGYIKLLPDAKNYSAVYSLILTAHTTEHPLWLRTTDSGVCTLIYAVSDK
jgi:hypothetical protein